MVDPQFYLPRSIRPLGVLVGASMAAPSIIKFYGVTAREGQETPRSEIIEAAKRVIAFDRLPRIPEAPKSSIPQSELSVFVACVHEANGADFLLLGQWDGNVMHTRVNELDANKPGRIKASGKQPIPLCTWDLAILAFERNAWIENVLKNPTTAGIESYLACVLNALV